MLEHLFQKKKFEREENNNLYNKAKTNPFQYNKVPLPDLPKIKKQNFSYKQEALLKTNSICTINSFTSPIKKIKIEKDVNIKMMKGGSYVFDKDVQKVLINYATKRLSLINIEDQDLNHDHSKHTQQKNNKEDDLTSGVSKTQSKSNCLFQEINKENTSYFPKSGESNTDNIDIIRYNYGDDDQTIEISNMDTTSVNGSINKFNVMNSLARNLSSK